MAKRSTIKVKVLKDAINTSLERKGVDQEGKKALCTLLESVLMSTGNYSGFGSLTWKNGGYDQWLVDGSPDFPEKRKYLEPEYDRVYY